MGIQCLLLAFTWKSTKHEINLKLLQKIHPLFLLLSLQSQFYLDPNSLQSHFHMAKHPRVVVMGI